MWYGTSPTISSALTSLLLSPLLFQFLIIKVDSYLAMLRNELRGGEVELTVFSKMYHRSIVVLEQQENLVQEQVFFSPEDEAVGDRGVHNPVSFLWHFSALLGTQIMISLVTQIAVSSNFLMQIAPSLLSMLCVRPIV